MQIYNIFKAYSRSNINSVDPLKNDNREGVQEVLVRPKVRSSKFFSMFNLKKNRSSLSLTKSNTSINKDEKLKLEAKPNFYSQIFFSHTDLYGTQGVLIGGYDKHKPQKTRSHKQISRSSTFHEFNSRNYETRNTVSSKNTENLPTTLKKNKFSEWKTTQEINAIYNGTIKAKKLEKGTALKAKYTEYGTEILMVYSNNKEEEEEEDIYVDMSNNTYMTIKEIQDWKNDKTFTSSEQDKQIEVKCSTNETLLKRQIKDEILRRSTREKVQKEPRKNNHSIQEDKKDTSDLEQLFQKAITNPDILHVTKLKEESIKASKIRLQRSRSFRQVEEAALKTDSFAFSK